MSTVTLKRPLDSMGFVERESRNGKQLHFKCQRDFLYYCLNFYYPETFNPSAINPQEIDCQKLFGTPVPKYLAWTQTQFFHAPAFLKKHGLALYINDKKVSSYFDLMYQLLFSRLSYEKAMGMLEMQIQNNVATAIDIPISKTQFVLFDHVMFVYGYDEEYLYVLDTLTVPGLAYERVRDDVHYFRLLRALVKKNWCEFGRVWRVEKAAS
ncbi:hypothetical protein K2Y00_02200 [Patescibacteria group bacterium]|nr:hypothetical protein [Patescibacteria group bacterium]